MAIYHDVTYRAGYYDEYGRYTSKVESCTTSTRREHKTRKGLVKHSENAAFWDAYGKGLTFKYLITVDGNAA